MCTNVLFYYPRITGQAFSYCDTTLFEPSLRLLHKYLWVLPITIPCRTKRILSWLFTMSYPSRVISSNMTHTFRVKLACTFNFYLIDFTDAIIHSFDDSNPRKKEGPSDNVSSLECTESAIRASNCWTIYKIGGRFGQNWITGEIGKSHDTHAKCRTCDLLLYIW